MSSVLERFLRYVRIDTKSDETSPTSPSTSRQLDLSKLLEQECRELEHHHLGHPVADTQRNRDAGGVRLQDLLQPVK